MTTTDPIAATALAQLGLAGKRPLTELLEIGFRLQDLRDLARSRGWKLQGTSKLALIEQVVAYHQADDGWAAELRRLPVGLRALFQQMWVIGGVEGGVQSGMSQMLGQTVGIAPASYFQEVGKSQMSVQSFVQVGDRFFLWPDVYRVLPLDASWLAPLAETQRLGRMVPADPMRLALSAHRLSDYLAQNQLAAPSEYSVQWSLPSTTVPMHSERRGGEVIVRPQPPLVPLAGLERLAAGLDLERLETHLLLLAMAGLGFLERQTHGKITIGPEASERLRQVELADLARQFVQVILVTPIWSTIDSLFPPPSLSIITPSYVPSTLLTQENIRWRQVVARTLLLLEPGVWYSLADLLQRLYQLRTFVTSASSLGSLGFLTEDGRRMDPSKDSGWQATLKRIYTYLLTGPFHYLGLVDLGYGGSELAAIRLTPFCRYFLGLAAAPEQTAEPSSTGEISFDTPTFLRTRNASPALHILLSKLAAPGRGKQGQPGYVLSQDRLRASLSQGEDLDSLLKALAAVCDGPLPTAAVALVREWAATFGHYHAHSELTLIEFGDDLALPELLRSTELAIYLRRQFSPRLIAIERRHAEELFRRFVRQGYTPTLVDPDHKPT